MKTEGPKTKRYFQEDDIPQELEMDLLQSAREVVGGGYVPSYYAQIGSDFLWLYRAGYERGLKAGRAKKKRAPSKP